MTTAAGAGENAASKSGGLNSLLGSAGDAGKQLFMWGLLVGLINQATQPFQRDLQYLVNGVLPNQVQSPQDLASMVVRGVRDQKDATGEARSSGIDATRFAELVHLAGEPPALQQVLQWWRRGYVEWGEVGPNMATVANAIATSRVYTYWSDTIRKAQFVPPSAADAVNAVLRNQISKEQGIALAYFAGLGTSELQVPHGADTTDTERAFQILVDTTGNPPSPSELVEFVRRNLITLGDTTPKTVAPDPTALTFAQGILEGNTKDKWLPLYADLVKYIPPPRTITTVYKDGGFTYAEALQHFAEAGMSKADATAYLQAADGTKIAGTKILAQSTVLALYTEKAISHTQAATMLGHLGYSTTAVDFILAVQDFQREKKAIDSGVSRLQTLFVDHKISQPDAQNALATLGIPASQVTTLLETWTVERASNVKQLTETQIVDGWEYGSLTQQEAEQRLVELGYGPLDAWVLMSNKNKAPLGTKPTTNVNPLYSLPGQPAPTGTGTA